MVVIIIVNWHLINYIAVSLSLLVFRKESELIITFSCHCWKIFHAKSLSTPLNIQTELYSKTYFKYTLKKESVTLLLLLLLLHIQSIYFTDHYSKCYLSYSYIIILLFANFYTSPNWWSFIGVGVTARTLQSILIDFSSAVVGMVFIILLMSSLSSLFSRFFSIVPRAPTMFGITLMFCIFFSSLARVSYQSSFLSSFTFTLQSAGTAKSTKWQVLWVFFVNQNYSLDSIISWISFLSECIKNVFLIELYFKAYSIYPSKDYL